MPRTDKIKGDGYETWIEYTHAAEQPKGGWKASATGYMKHTVTGRTHETASKVAYGRTAGHAEEGARKRVQAVLDRTVTFWTEEPC
jgi:hypothetical protein